MRGYLALDVGTTNVKAVAVSPTGEILAEGSTPISLQLSQPGFVEQNPHEILKALASAIKKLHVHTEIDFLALGLSTQRESVIAWDRRSGEPLSPLISWQDSRTRKFCERFTPAQRSLVKTRTGLSLDAMYAGTKMSWLWDRLPTESSAIISTLDSFLIYQITGGKTVATDATNASRTLLMDLKGLQWDEQLCELLKVPKSNLPEIRPSGADYGYSSPDSVLGQRLAFRCVMGDSHAALFGQRCDNPGEGKVTFGTGSSVMITSPSDSFAASIDSSVDTTLAFTTPRPHLAREGNVLAAGAAMDSTAQFLTDGDVGELVALAVDCKCPEPPLLVPAYTGLAAPHWDRNAKATLVNLKRDTTREDVAYASVCSIGHQVADILDEMQRTGAPVKTLYADGGPSGNPAFMQLQADILGITLHASVGREFSSLGVARGAAYEMNNGEEFDSKPINRIPYKPSLPANEQQLQRRSWRDAILRSMGKEITEIK